MFCLAFIFPALLGAAGYLLLILIAFVLMDILILFLAKNGIDGTRIAPEKLSNGVYFITIGSVVTKLQIAH